MTNYVDLHNHILPAVDDGPRTIAQSVQLARAMVAAGYDTVVATPHTSAGKPSVAQILERLNELQNVLNRLEIPLKLLPGAEQHIEPQTLELLQSGKLLTLNRSRYLLFELPFLHPLPVYTRQLIAALVKNGYIPVIPHPERSVELLRNWPLLRELHQLGALFQVTWGALSGKLGRAEQQMAEAMLKANLAHFFATDAHRSDSRLLLVGEAAFRLEQLAGPDSAQLMLSDRPRRLLADQLLALPAAKSLPVPARIKVPLIKKLRRTIGY